MKGKRVTTEERQATEKVELDDGPVEMIVATEIEEVGRSVCASQ